MSNAPVFLPDRIRPRPGTTRRKRNRRPPLTLATLLAVVFAGIALFNWRIDEVRIASCPGLPPCVAENFRALEGTWVPALDLEALQKLINCWPGIQNCDISLQLPGRLVIRASATPVAASIQTSRGWHAVSPEGEIGRSLDRAVFPVLENFPLEPAQLRRGLETGKRTAEALDGKVLLLRWISPDDIEIQLEFAHREKELYLHVLPEGGPAENWFYTHFENLEQTIWADLRRPDRIVVRELS